MPRKKFTLLPGKDEAQINCFAFYRSVSGKPGCHALSDVYCLKETAPCSFRRTVAEAAAARERSYRRLVARGLR